MGQIIDNEKIHRKYPKNGWEFRAISVRYRDDDRTIKDIIYGKTNDRGKQSVGVEVYSGKNYIVGSKDKSYSRKYDLNEIPKKYIAVVNFAKEIYNRQKWSNASEININ